MTLLAPSTQYWLGWGVLAIFHLIALFYVIYYAVRRALQDEGRCVK